jgi:hypothetical protein
MTRRKALFFFTGRAMLSRPANISEGGRAALVSSNSNTPNLDIVSIDLRRLVHLPTSSGPVGKLDPVSSCLRFDWDWTRRSEADWLSEESSPDEEGFITCRLRRWLRLLKEPLFLATVARSWGSRVHIFSLFLSIKYQSSWKWTYSAWGSLSLKFLEIRW